MSLSSPMYCDTITEDDCEEFVAIEDAIDEIITVEDVVEEIDYVIHEEDDSDCAEIEEMPIKKVDREDFFRRRNLVLIRQNVDRDKNAKSGWSNPDLSSGRSLNEEVEHYQRIFSDLGRERSEKLEQEFNESFQRIAGYYCNFEYRWYGQMSGCFDFPEEFFDFYYDLLILCLQKFESGKDSVQHKNDFRKSNDKCHFNQYFFGALEKRKITEIKKRFVTKRNPYVICEVCGEPVVKITDFHLKHRYDENRIKKQFKMIPTKSGIGDKEARHYDMCPICGEPNVTVSHIAGHPYDESLTVEDYVKRFPSARLSAAVVSLQAKMPNSENEFTLEDVYISSVSSDDYARDLTCYEEHIDYVLRDKPFLSEVLKLKLVGYQNKEIAEEIGCKVAKVNTIISKIKKNYKILSQLFPNYC